jgi:hypothetical protein
MLGTATVLAPDIDKKTGVPLPLVWAWLAVLAESAAAIALRSDYSPGGLR